MNFYPFPVKDRSLSKQILHHADFERSSVQWNPVNTNSASHGIVLVITKFSEKIKMTDKFGPKAPSGIPINIFKKLASAQGTMGRENPFPASPGRTFFSPLPRPHSPLIYHTTQRVPREAEREREAEEVA